MSDSTLRGGFSIVNGRAVDASGNPRTLGDIARFEKKAGCTIDDDVKARAPKGNGDTPDPDAGDGDSGSTGTDGDLSDKTVKELREMASDRDVTIPRGTDKDGIIDLLNAA